MTKCKALTGSAVKGLTSVVCELFCTGGQWPLLSQ